MVPLICEINLHMDQKSDALSAEIRQLQDQCEEVSKRLFGPQARKKRPKYVVFIKTTAN